jgi:hypothetical protein
MSSGGNGLDLIPDTWSYHLARSMLLQGIPGVQGARGEKGERGDKGLQGDKGRKR